MTKCELIMSGIARLLSVIILAIFSGGVSKALGVKSGLFSADLASGSEDTYAGEIVAPPRLTINEALQSAFTAPSADDPKKAVIEFTNGTNRHISLYPTSANPLVVGGGVEVAALSKDEDKPGSAPLTNAADDIDDEADPLAAGIQNVINGMIETRKPSVSLASLMTAIENYWDGLEQGDKDAMGNLQVLVNQADGTVKLFRGGTHTTTNREVKITQDTTPPADAVQHHFE